MSIILTKNYSHANYKNAKLWTNIMEDKEKAGMLK